jgi:hypothetical protein
MMDRGCLKHSLDHVARLLKHALAVNWGFGAVPRGHPAITPGAHPAGYIGGYPVRTAEVFQSPVFSPPVHPGSCSGCPRSYPRGAPCKKVPEASAAARHGHNHSSNHRKCKRQGPSHRTCRVPSSRSSVSEPPSSHLSPSRRPCPSNLAHSRRPSCVTSCVCTCCNEARLAATEPSLPQRVHSRPACYYGTQLFDAEIGHGRSPSRQFGPRGKLGGFVPNSGKLGHVATNGTTCSPVTGFGCSGSAKAIRSPPLV